MDAIRQKVRIGMSAEDIEYMGDYKEFPTKESALDWLDYYLSLDERNNLIRALQQEPVLDKITEIIEPLRHLSFDEMSDVEWQTLQVINKYKADKED